MLAQVIAKSSKVPKPCFHVIGAPGQFTAGPNCVLQ
jgi:hypothetical protein